MRAILPKAPAMSEKRSFLRATGVVAAITGLSRFLGLIRDSVVGAGLGASRVNDVFQIAFELPNLARRVLGEGALSAFIVPLFGAERREHGEKAGWLYASNALTAVTLLSAILTILGCFFAKPLFLLFGGFGMLARGGQEDAVLLGAALTRIMYPYLMFLAMSALLMGLCHTVKRFAAPAFGSVMINITMIAAIGLYWLFHRDQYAASRADPAAAEAMQIQMAYWLSYAVLAGILARLLLHFPSLWAEGFRYRPHLDLKQKRLRQLFAKMPMALAGMAVAQLNISIDMFFATYMNEGYATHLRYSSHLVQMPLGMLASAMATAILPSLARYFDEGRREELADLFGFAMRLTLLLFIPATVGMIVLGGPIVGLLFERMNWTAAATEGTRWALLFYSLGLVPAAGLRLVTPLYYARLDLRTPVIAGVVGVFVNIVFDTLFFALTTLGQGGLALATTISMAANLALLLFFMRQRAGAAMDRRLAETALKTAVAGVAMGLALWAAMAGWRQWIGALDSFVPRLVFLGLAIPLGGLFYFAAASALRTPDLRRARQIALGWLRGKNG